MMVKTTFGGDLRQRSFPKVKELTGLKLDSWKGELLSLLSSFSTGMGADCA